MVTCQECGLREELSIHFSGAVPPQVFHVHSCKDAGQLSRSCLHVLFLLANTLDPPVKTPAQTIENAFGPLFFDFLWNGLFMRGCKFQIIMDFLLQVSTREVMSMNYLQKYITADGKQIESEIYILSAEILATLAWMCDAAVAVDTEFVRTNSVEGRKDHLEFFLKAPPGEQNPYEFLFQKKLGEFLASKKRSSRVAELAVGDCVMVEQPRFRPPSLIPSKRVSSCVRFCI